MRGDVTQWTAARRRRLGEPLLRCTHAASLEAADHGVAAVTAVLQALCRGPVQSCAIAGDLVAELVTSGLAGGGVWARDDSARYALSGRERSAAVAQLTGVAAAGLPELLAPFRLWSDASATAGAAADADLEAAGWSLAAGAAAVVAFAGSYPALAVAWDNGALLDALFDAVAARILAAAAVSADGPRSRDWLDGGLAVLLSTTPSIPVDPVANGRHLARWLAGWSRVAGTALGVHTSSPGASVAAMLAFATGVKHVLPTLLKRMRQQWTALAARARAGSAAGGGDNLFTAVAAVLGALTAGLCHPSPVIACSGLHAWTAALQVVSADAPGGGRGHPSPPAAADMAALTVSQGGGGGCALLGCAGRDSMRITLALVPQLLSTAGHRHSDRRQPEHNPRHDAHVAACRDGCQHRPHAACARGMRQGCTTGE
jgi:hypothetical protein